MVQTLSPTHDPLEPRDRRTRRSYASPSGSWRRERVKSPTPLGRYLDGAGRLRELITEQAHAGSVLVIDRDAATRCDGRLVAHLGPDEPLANAALMARHFLADPRAQRPLCRRVSAEDATSEPFAAESNERPTHADEHELSLDAPRGRFQLDLVQSGMSIPELRWRHHQTAAGQHATSVVSLRAAVAAVESYEPLRHLTRVGLVRHGGRAEVSTTVLRLELARVSESPIVLNRRLRETVLSTVAQGELSMSAIAMRCGRVKHDSKGNQSGETSWLARRLGLLPEGGQSAPTPWIHSDVLALIARAGLGISPREVEL